MTQTSPAPQRYDFDTVIDRRGTCSMKYDLPARPASARELIPLWVADMDFALPPDVIAPVKQLASRGMFGYTLAGDEYYQAVCGWFARHHGWSIDPGTIALTPGVVFALAVAVQTFTRPGEGIIIQPPVYHPFAHTITDNGRRVVSNPLVREDGRYHIDFAHFEECAQQPDVTMFMLCNPHNPIGQVWSEQDLRRLGEICLRHNVLVVADEIHCDFVWPGHRHVPFATLGQDLAERSIICTAASKTFSLAGLQTSNIVIPNEDLRQHFRTTLEQLHLFATNCMGLAATQAVYTRGEEWYRQMKDYVWGNICFVQQQLEARIPGIRMHPVEGTYLPWLDCSGLGLAEDEVDRFFLEEAGLWLNAGTIFGQECSQFERINVACPRATLKRAIDQLEQAVCGLK